MPPKTLSTLAHRLIRVFENKESNLNDEKITVNALVSKVASFYEKFRTAMDYGSEETIPRRAIERMLKRMLFLNEKSSYLAEGLVRELIWAGYFPNATVPQSLINRVTETIDLHFQLKEKVHQNRNLPSEEVSELIIELLSCDILYVLVPNREKEAIANFMFKILQNTLVIPDDSEQTKDIQIFLAIRKSFAKDDVPFLKYKLFTQIFGRLSAESIDQTVANFENGYKEIKYQLTYPKKERILAHVKKITPPFLILYDILIKEKGNVEYLIKDEEEFRKYVFAACELRYRSIKRKIRTAIVRSFVFILFTKAILALSIEGTFESIFLGKIQWLSIVLNTVIPPLIMAGVGIGIKTPSDQNSEIIYNHIVNLLTEENPTVANTISIKLKSKSAMTLKDYFFSIFWILTIFSAFGIMWLILGKLHFNILSKGIFVFFIAIISFLSYRIYQTANTYTVFKKQNLFTPLFEFFFIPVIRVGRSLTEGFAQINFILLIIDFIIEAPFKGLIGFFEQWFLFVAAKREELE